MVLKIEVSNTGMLGSRLSGTRISSTGIAGTIVAGSRVPCNTENY